MHEHIRGSRLTGVVVPLLIVPFAFAQRTAAQGVSAPTGDHDVGTVTFKTKNVPPNSPESDGRPGEKFFIRASRAIHEHDYRFAIQMLKVSASWAYKPAEYDLSVMYFNGIGISQNHSLGAAWMVLAAERGDPQYVYLRNLMVTSLSKAEFVQTDEYWGQLRKTYGDKVALRRAEAQWAFVGKSEVGSHLGHPAGPVSEKIAGPSGFGSLANAVGAPGIAGQVVYQQFHEDKNPYSPIFQRNRSGNVTVEPLQSARRKHAGARLPNAEPTSGTQLQPASGSSSQPSDG